MKIQIVVGSELEGDEFVPLRFQKENATEDDIRKFIEMCGELREQADKDMADTIIQISISNNKKTYQKLKEENDMSQALEELMQDRIMARTAESRAEGHREGRAEGRKEGWTEGRKDVPTFYQDFNQATCSQRSRLPPFRTGGFKLCSLLWPNNFNLWRKPVLCRVLGLN